MVLRQPRVQRREGNERRETLGYELEIGDSPKGAALTVGFLYDLGPPLRGSGVNQPPYPGLRVVRREAPVRDSPGFRP